MSVGPRGTADDVSTLWPSLVHKLILMCDCENCSLQEKHLFVFVTMTSDNTTLLFM